MTSNASPSPSFQAAAAYLSSYKGDTSNATKLELYGLYKYVMVSPSPDSSRPSIFDFTGRAKWDAWSAAGQRYDSPHEAEARYAAIAKELGWDGTLVSTAESTSDPKQAGDDDDIWDKEDDSSRRGGGLGVAVSSIFRPDEIPDLSLHGLVVDGDVGQLKELLRIPGIDLNEKDEYGYTPLHLASDRGHLEVVKVLLDKGANPTIKDADDFTPRELAEIAGNAEIAALLLSA